MNQTEKKKSGFTFYGMPAYIFIPLAIPLLLAGFIWDSVPVELVGAVSVIFTLGIFFGEIGNRLPIWSKYLGGGSTFTLIVVCALKTLGVLPSSWIENSTSFISEWNWMNLFVATIVVGSLLAIKREMIFKQLALYIPAILCCILGSSIFGIAIGFLFGKSPIEVLTSYVFPMLGGGIAVGAVPMSQIYGEITGTDPTAWLSSAISIITMGNLIAVILAVAYDILGNKFPSLTSHGVLMKSGNDIEDEDEESTPFEITPTGVIASFSTVASLYMTAYIISKFLLPRILGVPIHTFAYLIILSAIINAAGLLPEPLKCGCTKLQTVLGGRMGWMMMAGVGMSLIDVENLVGSLNPETIIIVFFIVLGGSIFAGIFGYFVGFYPIESAMTAGLCMTDMGGAGDLAILGAANRMSLMAYSSVSTRVGAAIMLLLASVGFTFLA